eukprot:CAMPEP_0172564050 /NCGR_PEP_ID=MMETSP1067-20121228/102894_1 /TAXON_ID=265564 ORGANISM="Thalassiosira punctigera, Strain Tpunct2005C2" /NCGR_SAMPLE_ID=MMETSP1067 /ASSEMBLY_ACC=CAM_ASM_000444 /LENGTH=38 /DNA_ID= /DNA_START= /DNA_END= /DNA_ORIENTATION=
MTIVTIAGPAIDRRRLRRRPRRPWGRSRNLAAAAAAAA